MNEADIFALRSRVGSCITPQRQAEKLVQARAEDVDVAAEDVSVASFQAKMVERAGVGGSGAAADADANGSGGRLSWDRGTRDIFPLPRFASRLPPCKTPRTSQQRQRRRVHHHWSDCNETIDSLNWLAGFKEPSGQLVSSFVV